MDSAVIFHKHGRHRANRFVVPQRRPVQAGQPTACRLQRAACPRVVVFARSAPALKHAPLHLARDNLKQSHRVVSRKTERGMKTLEPAPRRHDRSNPSSCETPNVTERRRLSTWNFRTGMCYHLLRRGNFPFRCAPVAQWIEHLPPEQGVGRSNRLGRAT